MDIRTKLVLTLDSGVGFACEHARVRSDHVSDGSGRVRHPNDGPVMLISSGVLALCASKARPIGRTLGIGMLLVYMGYWGTLYAVV